MYAHRASTAPGFCPLQIALCQSLAPGPRQRIGNTLPVKTVAAKAQPWRKPGKGSSRVNGSGGTVTLSSVFFPLRWAAAPAGAGETSCFLRGFRSELVSASAQAPPKIFDGSRRCCVCCEKGVQLLKD